VLKILVALGLAANPQRVLEKYECSRCHEVEAVAAPPAEKQCAGCHLEVAHAPLDPARMAAGHAEYGAAFDRFTARTARVYVDVPPLKSLKRFRASWLTSFLSAPYDLRPHLAESMPRLPMTTDEVATLVKGLGLQPTVIARRPSKAVLARGAVLFEAKGCTSCHLFGNARFASQPAELFVFERPARSALARAPDLRHVRDRSNRDVVVKTLLDPSSVNRGSQMPRLEVTVAEAETLADFLIFTDVEIPHVPQVAAEVKGPLGQVRYEDVEARVFRKVCWHCHSNADAAGGDGGPGNTGGFGFKGVGLSFATWEEVMNGAQGPDGEYRSIFRRGVTGEPVLIEVLKQRVHENRRDFVKPGHARRQQPGAAVEQQVLGMPLGLPAIDPEDLALVEAWVAAGTPRPQTPSGSAAGPMGR
jgi:cytochrome c551/c552